MAVSQRFERIISADSHVMEPLDTWWNSIGYKFGDRTPRVVDEFRGKKGKFFYTGYQDAPAIDLSLFKPTPETEAAALEAVEKGMAEAGYDPAVRVRFQEEAGVEAEVMNTTQMLLIIRNPDTEVLQACAEVFNDWIAEFCSHNPKRLIGTSVIPMHDIEWAIKELERTTKKGLMAPMINCAPPGGCPSYQDPVYDRFWAIAEEADIPITLHLLTGRELDPFVISYHGRTPEEREENPGVWLTLCNEIQGVLANDFIFGGVLDRFSKLRIFCSEYEMSWIPGFLARLDQMQEVASDLFLPKLKDRASDYMKERIWHGFIADPTAQFAVPTVGADKALWGSDFPHINSIGLDAQEVVNTLLDALPREDQEKIVGGNAAKVFNLD